MSNESKKYVTRRGIIFRPGSYGAKETYSDADIDAMAGDNPLPINIEHKKTLLDGFLGHLTRRFSGYDDQGRKVLMGEWQEPEPLALLLGDTERKVSIEIDMATKQPVGLALTHSPAITDAALFSAFSAYERGEEVKPLASSGNSTTSPATTYVDGYLNRENARIRELLDMTAMGRRVLDDQIQKRGK